MSTLAQKIRESRKIEIEVGDSVFIGRRPSVVELSDLIQSGAKDPALARTFISGWRNVKESDLVSDGSPELVAFDEDLWAEIVADCPHLYTPIAKALVEATTAHVMAREAQTKNLKAGSKPAK